MKFDAEFFKEEKRNGFIITTMMKHAWAAELKVMSMIDDICRKYDITYFADWGTLLGTVRHKGFIPWDDDIDICMKRADFNKFAKVMEDEYDDLELHSVFHDSDWGMHAAHVSTKYIILEERDKIKEWYGFPFQVGIDIFIIDAMPCDEELKREQIDILKMISDAVKYRDKKLFPKIENSCNIKFNRDNPSNQELLILAEEVMEVYNDSDFKYYTQKDCYVNWDNYAISKTAYSKVIRMPFENITLPVPIGYDEILRLKYGEDYMTPRNVGAGHGYPFYSIFLETIYKNKNFQTKEEADNYIKNTSYGFYDKFLRREFTPNVVYDEDRLSNDGQRIRASQTEILYELERVCDEEEIKLFAIGHTLENTFRYHGYAPDDESVTLGVMRCDYQKFLRVLQEKLDVWFDYRSIYFNENFDRISTLVITDSYMCDTQEVSQRFHGCKYTVGIEVFPIDYVSDDMQKEETRNTLVKNLYLTANCFPSQAPYDEKLLTMARQWNDSMNLKLNLEGNLKREFLKIADFYMGMFDRGNKVRVFGNALENMDRVYNKKSFENAILKPFENIKIPVPVGYKEIMEK